MIAANPPEHVVLLDPDQCESYLAPCQDVVTIVGVAGLSRTARKIGRAVTRAYLRALLRPAPGRWRAYYRFVRSPPCSGRPRSRPPARWTSQPLPRARGCARSCARTTISIGARLEAQPNLTARVAFRFAEEHSPVDLAQRFDGTFVLLAPPVFLRRAERRIETALALSVVKERREATVVDLELHLGTSGS